ncbi:MAG: XRE family transcriptional regulator [Rhodospirillaceae bacterium]|nr:MAG: XRE family transcriptional regulator [Rhodospirillaceae bacterium]
MARQATKKTSTKTQNSDQASKKAIPEEVETEAAPVLEFQDPHKAANRDGGLEKSIGHEVREFRRQLNMTVAELAAAANLSAGMLSKIENGQTSPSLATLQELSRALHVPVTALFRKFEEERNATFVKAGQGLTIERRGTRAGHQYQLLGHSLSRSLAVEPYLITLTQDSDVFPVFQHDGIEFIYMLEGEVGYRHGDKTYLLGPGDSLFFDSDAPHGPEELRKLPAKYISVITYSRTPSDTD